MSMTLAGLEYVDLDLFRGMLEDQEVDSASDIEIKHTEHKGRAYDTKEHKARMQYYDDLARQIAATILSRQEYITDWHQSAVCAYLPDEDKDVFYGGPERSSKALKTQNVEIATAICGLCTVRDLCFKEGLANDDKHAVRGGFTIEKMAKLVKKHNRRNK